MSFPKIGAPATRALIAACSSDIAELRDVSDAELLTLHGVGPKAVRLIRAALAGVDSTGGNATA